MSCDEEICSTYNGFFASTMSNSNIPTIEPLFNQLDPRIKNGSCNLTFSFRQTNCNEVSKIIDNLNTKNPCQNIPTKIIKLNKDITEKSHDLLK